MSIILTPGPSRKQKPIVAHMLDDTLDMRASDMMRNLSHRDTDKAIVSLLDDLQIPLTEDLYNLLVTLLGDSLSLSLESLCDIHRLIFHGSETDFFAGQLRTINARGGDWGFCMPHEIVGELTRAFDRLHHLTPGEIVLFTVDVVGRIHPFLDGNRRTLWLYANVLLMRGGYSPIVWRHFRQQWESSTQISGLKRVHGLLTKIITPELTI